MQIFVSSYLLDCMRNISHRLTTVPCLALLLGKVMGGALLEGALRVGFESCSLPAFPVPTLCLHVAVISKSPDLASHLTAMPPSHCGFLLHNYKPKYTLPFVSQS